MKTSTEHLPPCCREELRVLRSLTVRHIPDCCLIILGGSHAGQDYVPWSESVVRGRHTLYRHDYEIAVFVEGTETKKASRTLRRRIAGTYDGLFRFRRHTTPRFIVESVGTLTEQSKRGHYSSTTASSATASCCTTMAGTFRAIARGPIRSERWREPSPDSRNIFPMRSICCTASRPGCYPPKTTGKAPGGFTRPATSSTAPYGRYIRIILPERCRSTNWADWSSVTPASSQKFSPAMTISRPKATNCFAALRKKRGAAYSATRANGWVTCYAEPRRSGFSRKRILRRANRVLHGAGRGCRAQGRSFPGNDFRRKINPHSDTVYRKVSYI